VGAAYLLIVLPHVWRTPLRAYIESAMTSLRAGWRSRILGLVR